MKSLRSFLSRLEKRFRLMTMIGALGPTITALALQFLTFGLTARWLGVEQFGALTAAFAISSIAVELVGLGGADLLVRATATRKEAFPRYFGNLINLGAISFPLVLAGCMAVGVFWAEIGLSPLSLLLLLAGEIVIGRVSSSVELIMVAHRQTVRASWIRLCTAAIRTLLAVCVFVLADVHDVGVWALATFCQSVLTAGAYLLLVARLYGRPVWSLLTAEMGAGAAFSLNQSARAAQSNLDRLVLSRFADASALGAYGAASRVLQLGLFPVQVATRILYPQFFVHGAEGAGAVRKFTVKCILPMAAAGAFGAAMVVAAALFVPRLLGEGFESSTGLAIGLACALPLIALQYPAADALTAIGRQGLRSAIYGVTAIGFGAVLALGAWLYGIDGLLVSFVAGHFVLAAVLWLAALLVTRSKPAPE